MLAWGAVALAAYVHVGNALMTPTMAKLDFPPRTEPTWTLVSQAGDATFALSRLPAILGRRAGVDICIPQPSVSGRHAEFLSDGATLLVRDLGSTNGTYVNGRRIEKVQPLAHNDLLHFGEAVFRIIHQPGIDSATVNATRCAVGVCDQALALVQFDRLLSHRAVTPYYQPIVTAETGETVAYEVLGRSPLVGLATPGPMFQAAAVLQKEAELSQLLRVEGIRLGHDKSPHLFLNTHPRELEDMANLCASLRELRRMEPDQQFTLELHESAAVDRSSLTTLRTALQDLKIGLAYDDFGAGQARLAELVDTSPDYVKFDMRLIRGIHTAPEAQRTMVASLVRLVNELGILPLAEGVEAAEEAQVCREMGFKLFQGYHFGRPAAAPVYFGESESLVTPTPNDAS